MAAALLLAGDRDPDRGLDAAPRTGRGGERGSLCYGWPLAAAGLAVGLAVGTRLTIFAMAAALSVAVIVLAPAGRRWKAAGWWFVRRPARRRLLVPAQPARRRQPAPGGDRPRADLPAPPGAPAGRPPRLQHLPLRSPTPASGATTSSPACTTPSAPSGRWSWSPPSPPACWRSSPAATSWSAGSAASRSSAWSPTSSPRSARPGRRANRSASRSTSATSSRPCWRRSSWCRCRASSTPPKRQWGLIAVLVVVYLVTDRPDHALHDKAARSSRIAFVIVFVAVPALIWLARRDGAPARRDRRRARRPGGRRDRRSATRSSATT